MSQQDDLTGTAEALTGTAEAVEAAACHVRGGGLVVLPTDTVYGIGCSATVPAAVSRLLTLKGRGDDMPPPVLVASVDDLDSLVAGLPQAGRRLVEALWPGALTLVLDAAPEAGLGWERGRTAGAAGTVAVRMPAHPLALALLRSAGPMAVTSANLTGNPPATDADQARAAFPGRIRPAGLPAGGIPAGRPEEGLPAEGLPGSGADILLLDAGPTPGPVPSTIVDLSGRCAGLPRILRHGALDAERLAAVVGPLPAGEEARR